MKASIQALVWELGWKHRVIFVALVLLYAMGAMLAWQIALHRPEDPWWLGKAQGITLVAFLTSLLMGYAPFSMMESSGGWRMNSMTTRWFVLPIRTPVMVLMPLAAAIAFIVAVFAVWVPLLGRALGPGLDASYFGSALVLGVVFLQAVAWTVPRRPAQYWAVAGLVLPFTLLLALIPQDQPDTSPWRQHSPMRFALLTMVLGAFALFAARQNRSGAWPGHVPLERLWDWLRRGRPSARTFRSAGHALFRADALSTLRFLAVSWGLLIVTVLTVMLLAATRRRSGRAINLELVVLAVAHVWPFLAMLWLAVWGLTLGSEPGGGFRTRLTGYRATLPVGAAVLASPRLKALGLGWAMLWLPVAALTLLWLPNVRGIWDYDGVDTIRSTLAWRMALSGSLLAGALPVCLWGRFEGLPNLLLAGMCAWGGTSLLAGFLGTDQPDGTCWMAAGALVAMKLGATVWAFWRGRRAGVFEFRYAAILVLGWLAAAALVLVTLPWQSPLYRWRLVGLLILLPMARLAFCPLAVAANRSR